MNESSAVGTAPVSARRAKSPYVGPRPFRENEPFFGREREAKNLVNTLLSGKVVLLHSPSGAGKTSLIQAAIVPAFEEREFQVCSAQTQGFSALRVNLPPPPDLEVSNRYVFSLVNGMVGHYVDKLDAVRMRIPEAADLFASQNRSDRLLFVIDQLEEVLTTDPGDVAAQKTFFRQLGEALDHDRRWALLAIREDYMGGLDRFQRYLPGQLRATFRLDLLGDRAAMAAVKRPATAFGVDFTDDAVKLIVDELRRVQTDHGEAEVGRVTSPYVEPVLLQVVCDSLWRRLSVAQGAELSMITKADVEAFRPFNAALSEYYRHVVREASDHDHGRERKVREWIDRRLISSQGLRRPTSSAPEVDGAEGVLNALQHRYLIREDPRPGGSWWELSHDLLVAPIREDNQTWRAGNLAAWQVMADKWHRTHHDPLYLLGPADLRTALQQSRKVMLTDTEKKFLADSRAAVAAKGRLERLKQLNTAYTFALLISLAANFVLILLLLR
jgi:hypothetical protein